MISASLINNNISKAASKTDAILQNNAGVVLMLLAQVCSTIMATLGRVLQTGGSSGSDTRSIGTSEILIVMMLIITVLSWTYILVSPEVFPDGVFGPAKLRPLLVIRGIAGFFGIWGFYVSLQYLAVAEATLINFLAPVFAALLLGLLPGQQRCSVPQMLAALVAIMGLLCVLQPWNAHATNASKAYAMAVGAALVGVVGAAASFMTMSYLGGHVHPIITVAYFAPTCVVLSGASLIIQQESLSFPSAAIPWLLVCAMGILGFAKHSLMAASLMTGDSKKALHIVYVQVVFAMVADKIVWGLVPGWWKYAGALLIVGSAVFVAVTKEDRGYSLVREMDVEEKIGNEDAT
ncbi:hypothetical protein ACET3X_007932 [Alternaria dauci]|uniref:EamA domain-containing protein n=1 Tax=Alternaria dauci TaxID=48095 RepID=A0ABR3UG06_9PLEO